MSKKVIFLIVFVVVVAAFVFVGIFGAEIGSLITTVSSDSVTINRIEVIGKGAPVNRDIRIDKDGIKYVTVNEGTVRIRIYWEVLPLNVTDSSINVSVDNPAVFDIEIVKDKNGKQIYCDAVFKDPTSGIGANLTISCNDKSTHKDVVEIRIIFDSNGGEG